MLPSGVTNFKDNLHLICLVFKTKFFPTDLKHFSLSNFLSFNARVCSVYRRQILTYDFFAAVIRYEQLQFLAFVFENEAIKIFSYTVFDIFNPLP